MASSATIGRRDPVNRKRALLGGAPAAGLFEMIEEPLGAIAGERLGHVALSFFNRELNVHSFGAEL